MEHAHLSRTLRYKNQAEERDILQEDLHLHAEPLVILGEAGMGKTSLLSWLAETHGYAHCTANNLLNRHNPKTLLNDSKVLVIDALDEVSSHGAGDAIDRILQKLGELDYPRFILSCRVADWRSATGTQAISEQYDQPPLQLHLNPLTNDDVQAFLGRRLTSARAESTIEHFEQLGFSDWLGNPQTLDLIITAISGGSLPQTRSELFELAVRQLAHEHNDARADRQLPQATALSAAGAVCATLILSGCETITRKAQANISSDELSLTELQRLPDGQYIEQVLGARIFKATSPDSFGYMHRSIGEYLGAKWLAQQANTPRKRRRLLALFHRQEIVPASLRGLHGWLAQDPMLADEVIKIDPMSLVEYGDTSQFTLEQARIFLQAIKHLSENNPKFRDWRTLTARGIIQPDLLGELWCIINQADNPYGLRLLMLESFKGAKATTALKQKLADFICDSQNFYGLRSEAVNALLDILKVQEWKDIITHLELHNFEDSNRLALNIINLVGYPSFDNEMMARIVCAYSAQDERMVGKFNSLERNLPITQIANFLDKLIQAAQSNEFESHSDGKNDLADLSYHLISRYIDTEQLDAQQLWRWLEPFHNQHFYHNRGRETLHNHLVNNNALRQSVQKLVLIDENNDWNLWQRYQRLQYCSAGFTCSETDVIALLNTFNPHNLDDNLWRDIVQLVPHDNEKGSAVRTTARSFFEDYPDQLQWIDQLTQPRPPQQWEIEQAEWERKNTEEQEKELTTARQWYAENIEQLRQGEFSVIINPAKAYLGFVRSSDREIPAHERIEKWLGPDFVQPAHEGFEAYLLQTPPNSSAIKIAENYAENKCYTDEEVIVAAMAERYRNGVGLSDLSDDRVMAAFFIFRCTTYGECVNIQEIRQWVETEIKERGTFAHAIRQFHEPQLRENCEYINALHDLMCNKEHEDLAVELASDWLQEFPALRFESESLLTGRLLQSGHYSTLKNLIKSRMELTDNNRRLSWDAIGLIVDFEKTVARLESKPIEKDLLWYIRDRRLDEYCTADTPYFVSQLEWIIRKFRGLWPVVGFSSDVSMGDRNARDACEYLGKLINLLGGSIIPEAITTLGNLCGASPDSYTGQLLAVKAEQKRIRFETAYTPPSLGEIIAITHDQAPVCLVDLQTWVLEELSIVQGKIDHDDVDSWRGFYDDCGVPYAEERCRDSLLSLLRQGNSGVTYEPEAHVANDKEVDITCAVGTLRLPIEVKGQWHKEVWAAADQQLDQLYASDWRAEGYGIYLVLWFGEQTSSNKAIASPGRGIERPVSPEQMKEMLIEGSQAAQEGRIAIVVLDLDRSKFDT